MKRAKESSLAKLEERGFTRSNLRADDALRSKTRNTVASFTVEYAMSRHLSPALVAQYETQMIPKTVLQQKLHEWSQMLQAPESSDEDEL